MCRIGGRGINHLFPWSPVVKRGIFDQGAESAAMWIFAFLLSLVLASKAAQAFDCAGVTFAPTVVLCSESRVMLTLTLMNGRQQSTKPARELANRRGRRYGKTRSAGFGLMPLRVGCRRIDHRRTRSPCRLLNVLTRLVLLGSPTCGLMVRRAAHLHPLHWNRRQLTELARASIAARLPPRSLC